MKEKNDISQSFLNDLLLVTGICFLLFTLLLKILDGIIIKPFFWIGFTSFGVGLVAWVFFLINKKIRKDKNNFAS